MYWEMVMQPVSKKKNKKKNSQVEFRSTCRRSQWRENFLVLGYFNDLILHPQLNHVLTKSEI